MLHRPLVLSGFMGSGKSSVAPILAELLGVECIDVDARIAESAGRSVADLFASEGEAGFRARERDALFRCLESGPAVVAVGGGALVDRAVRHRVLSRATVVTLRASVATLMARLSGDGSRPLMASHGAEGLEQRIRGLLEARTDAYDECHWAVTTDGRTAAAVAHEVASLVAVRREAVPLGRRTYPIDFVHDDSSAAIQAVAGLQPSAVCIVTDENVARAREAALTALEAGLGRGVCRVVLPAGERHKTLASVERIWSDALAFGVDRRSVVVAFGGGVVGDLAGFAAATLLRGVRCVQVPTTLLAMVDSSVGGKTGFDFALGKNLIGAFHQPSHVVIDTAHVETLALREWVAGFGEVVKAAALAGEEFFGWLESHAAELVAVPHRLHGELVRRAVSQKIDVVVADEEESGVRAVLNLGHTFGHALESHGGFSRWLHGEAVSIGMVTELRAAAELGFASREVADRLERLLRRLGLPTTVPSEDVHAALLHIGRDKKRQGSFVRWPVLRAVGDAQLVDVELQRLETALQSLP